MSEKLLHACIGCGLIALCIFFASQVLNKQYVTHKVKVLEPTPTIQPTSTPIECLSPYLDVKVGTEWNYTVTTTKDKQVDKKSITTTLVSKDLGIMTFSTLTPQSKQPSSSTMICTSDGTLGLPFSLTDGMIGGLLEKIEFVPNRKTYKDTEWNSEIDMGTFLPINIQSHPLGLLFRVVEEKEISLQGKKVNAITIESSSDAKGTVDVSSFVKISYTLGEQVGLTHATIIANPPGQANQTIEIELKSMSNPL